MRANFILAPKKSRRAFTLIELMVVIGIIGILAALLLPVLNYAKKQAAGVQCKNNLRQLYIAINTYADDHGDYLPGPIWQGLYATYDTSPLFMPYYIATYLGAPAPSANVGGIAAAICPASARTTHQTVQGTLTTTLRQPISYIVSISVTNLKDDLVSRPFGYPYKHLPNSPTTVNEPSKRLKDIRDPGLSSAIVDTDQQNAVSLAQYYPFIPAAPVHGTTRNNLFFDGHVAAMK